MHTPTACPVRITLRYFTAAGGVSVLSVRYHCFCLFFLMYVNMTGFVLVLDPATLLDSLVCSRRILLTHSLQFVVVSGDGFIDFFITWVP